MRMNNLSSGEGIIHGEDVMQEVVTLLGQKQFSVEEGRSLQGETVVIYISGIQSETNTEDFDLLVHCVARSHFRVDWEKFPTHIALWPEFDNPYAAPRAEMDSKGRVLFRSIKRGIYSFCNITPPVVFPLDQVARGVAPDAEGALQPVLAVLHATGTVQQESVSSDGNLRATVIQNDDECYVNFEVVDPPSALHLANAVVRFMFVTDSGEVAKKDTVELKPFQGFWSQPLPLTEPARLVFTVNPGAA